MNTIILYLGTWSKQEAPYWVATRVYARGWWTPWCRITQQTHHTMGPFAKNFLQEHGYCCTLRIRHYHRKWWREKKE